MRLAILATLVTAVLLAGAVECAASCAAVTVEAPCHHHQSAPHHQDPVACSHELVLDRVHAPATEHGFETSGPMQAPLPDGRGSEPWWSRLVPRLSCNRQDAGSSLSLRI
jgi:hypothetical protein